MPIQALAILWSVPFGAFLLRRHITENRRWFVIGVLFGLVVSPASFGLYGLYFLGPWSAVLGMLGLPLALFHGAPGFLMARHLHWLESAGVVHGIRDHMVIEAINGITWCAFYGMLGAIADVLEKRRKPNFASV